MSSVGPGACEIRARDSAGAYRVTEIARGKVELLSLDYLVGLCAKVGISVGLKVAA